MYLSEQLGLDCVFTVCVVGTTHEEVGEFALPARRATNSRAEFVVICGGHGLTADTGGAAAVAFVDLNGGDGVFAIFLAATDRAVLVFIAIPLEVVCGVEATAIVGAGIVIVDTCGQVCDVTTSVTCHVRGESRGFLTRVRG